MCLSAVPLYGGDDNDIPEPVARKTFREITEEFPPRTESGENTQLLYRTRGKILKLDSDAVHFYELIPLIMRNIHDLMDEVWMRHLFVSKQEENITKKIFTSLLSDECEVLRVRKKKKWMNIDGFKRECRAFYIDIWYKEEYYVCTLMVYKSTELRLGFIVLDQHRTDLHWICEEKDW